MLEPTTGPDINSLTDQLLIIEPLIILPAPTTPTGQTCPSCGGPMMLKQGGGWVCLNGC